MGHLFISYSRNDAAFVDRLVLALEQYGLATWRDVNALAGGDVWKAEITKAVRECDVFLIVLSPDSVGSANVAKELAVGTKHARKVLPIMYRQCRIPDTMDYDLAQLQWIDFSKESQQTFVEAMERLVYALGKRPSAATAATSEVQALRTFLANLVMQTTHFIPQPQPPQPAQPQPALERSTPRFCIHCAAALVPGKAFCIGCGRPAAR